MMKKKEKKERKKDKKKNINVGRKKDVLKKK